MKTVYHPGELKIQEKVGAREAADHVGRTIYPLIAHMFVDFIQSQPLVILGFSDDAGETWASLLTGEPDFMQVVDEQTLRIKALPHEGDPLERELQDGSELGLLLIDFATRRRLRLNGRGEMERDGFLVHARQVYANCPRYIQARKCEWKKMSAATPKPGTSGNNLNPGQQQRIRQADTFFIASTHPVGGADVSHRGGFPGFVQVMDEQSLIWPEYNGNSMFNTLGNICENPKAGLLFPDFENGGTLQLSGTAEIVWDEQRAADFPGAERLIVFKTARVIQTDKAMGLCCSFLEYSPDNPWPF
ncbi:MAG: pyridoxamine 5'-phosphate oxidase family protein [Syntrophotaleaceae bacterium]